MVQWEGDRQIGLSPGQTGGSVNGVYVIRPAGQDVNTVYSPGVGSTSTKIDKYGNATTVKKDQYGNVVEVTTRGKSGNLIFQRKTTRYGGSVEGGLPVDVAGVNVAGSFQNIQREQEEQENLAQEYRIAQEQHNREKLAVARYQKIFGTPTLFGGYGKELILTQSEKERMAESKALAKARERQENISGYYATQRKRMAEIYDGADLGLFNPAKRVSQGVGLFMLGGAETALTLGNLGQTTIETKGDILKRTAMNLPRTFVEAPKQILWGFQDPINKYGIVEGGLQGVGQVAAMGTLAKITPNIRMPQLKGVRSSTFYGDIAIERTPIKTGLNRYANIYTYGKNYFSTISKKYGAGRYTGDIELGVRGMPIKEAFTLKEWGRPKPGIQVFPREVINPNTQNVISNIVVKSKTTWGGIRRITTITGEATGKTAARQGKFTIIGESRPMVRINAPNLKGQVYMTPGEYLKQITTAKKAGLSRPLKKFVPRSIWKDTQGSMSAQAIPDLIRPLPRTSLKVINKAGPYWGIALASMSAVRYQTGIKSRTVQILKPQTINTVLPVMKLRNRTNERVGLGLGLWTGVASGLRMGTAMRLDQALRVDSPLLQTYGTVRPVPTPGKPYIPRIPKIPIIKIPRLKMPEFNLGTGNGRRSGLKYKKIKTKMLTLKDLLGK